MPTSSLHLRINKPCEIPGLGNSSIIIAKPTAFINKSTLQVTCLRHPIKGASDDAASCFLQCTAYGAHDITLLLHCISRVQLSWTLQYAEFTSAFLVTSGTLFLFIIFTRFCIFTSPWQLCSEKLLATDFSLFVVANKW